MRVNYPPSWTPTDIAALDAMFSEARRSGLWFFKAGLTGPLWFSPDELEAEQKNGRFLWGAVNWTLRPPEVRLNEFSESIASILRERKEFERRMVGGG